MRRPIGTGQRITLEATFIPSENLKNLLERYAVLARCIESDPDANARLVVPGTAYRIPLTKNGVNVCSFSRRTSASGRLAPFAKVPPPSMELDQRALPYTGRVPTSWVRHEQ